MMRVLVAFATVLMVGCLQAEPAARDYFWIEDAPQGIQAACDDSARVQVTQARASGDGFRVSLRDGDGVERWVHDFTPGADDDVRSRVRGEPGTWRVEVWSLDEDEQSHGGQSASLLLMCL